MRRITLHYVSDSDQPVRAEWRVSDETLAKLLQLLNEEGEPV